MPGLKFNSNKILTTYHKELGGKKGVPYFALVFFVPLAIPHCEPSLPKLPITTFGKSRISFFGIFRETIAEAVNLRSTVTEICPEE